jgi:citrate synthase
MARRVEASAPARPAAANDRASHGKGWRTGLTLIEPNRILVRGYPLDEVMGRVSYGEAVYLLLVGELPTPAIGKLMEALLVALIDHGTTPPSTQAARTVATSGAPLRACVAAGVLGFGTYHGGDIEGCMQLLERGVALARGGRTYEDVAAELVGEFIARHEPVPGFGHRIHTHDPRVARLFQMALELDLDGQHLKMVRALERALNATRPPDSHIPINVDGAIAAVCSEIGLAPAVGSAMFIISRVPGLIAQSLEEQERERPMRQIDSSAVVYDGPKERRLPGTRK